MSNFKLVPYTYKANPYNETINKFISKNSKQFETLTFDETTELFKRMKDGDQDARKKIITANYKLVLFISSLYASNRSLSYEDIVSEGVIGLIKAVDDYDYTLGYAFATYASYWIKRNIQLYFLKKNGLNMSYRAYEILVTVRKAYDDYEKENNLKPSLAQISEITKIPIKNICNVLNSNVVSLNELLFKDDTSDSTKDSEFLDFVASDCNLEEVTINRIYKQDFRNVLERLLSKKELQIITMRFGFDECEPRSLESIGEELNLTRERIRQIEKNALNKLKHNQMFQKQFKDCI